VAYSPYKGSYTTEHRVAYDDRDERSEVRPPYEEADAAVGAVPFWQSQEILDLIVPRFSRQVGLIELLGQFRRKHDNSLKEWLPYQASVQQNKRHILQDLIRDVPAVSDESGKGWKLFQDIPSLEDPNKSLSNWDLQWEFGRGADAAVGADHAKALLQSYVKHLANAHDGEVVLAWEDWQHVPQGNLPREGRLWSEQFAINAAQRDRLRKLAKRCQGNPGGTKSVIPREIDLKQEIGSTRVFRPAVGGDGYHVVKGGVISLMEMFISFGERYTARELLFWYSHAPKLSRKRPHAWGSQEVRDAAVVRKAVYGHYGHRRRDANAHRDYWRL